MEVRWRVRLLVHGRGRASKTLKTPNIAHYKIIRDFTFDYCSLARTHLIIQLKPYRYKLNDVTNITVIQSNKTHRIDINFRSLYLPYLQLLRADATLADSL